MENDDGIKRIVVGLDFPIQHAKKYVNLATNISKSINTSIIFLTVILNSDISDTEAKIDATKLKQVEERARGMHESLVL